MRDQGEVEIWCG
uniref:Uncharacterized protein n=1 Tax=Arundo donax TaxID=35708 RepID=A0A0A9E8U0_ARUDO